MRLPKEERMIKFNEWLFDIEWHGELHKTSSLSEGIYDEREMLLHWRWGGRNLAEWFIKEMETDI